jgi:hypothetical protein
VPHGHPACPSWFFFISSLAQLQLADQRQLRTERTKDELKGNKTSGLGRSAAWPSGMPFLVLLHFFPRSVAVAGAGWSGTLAARVMSVLHALYSARESRPAEVDHEAERQ